MEEKHIMIISISCFWFQTELAFHAKALELYTKAYNQMASVDMEEDLQVSPELLYLFQVILTLVSSFMYWLYTH